MIKKYTQFITESLLDKLKGPTDEEIEKNLKSGFEKGTANLAKYLKYCEKYNLKLPTVEEINKRYRFVSKQQLLTDSIEYDSKNGVDIALELGADIDFLQQPLWFALYHNNYNMLKYLVEKGANINAGNGTILTFAVKHGMVKKAKYLLKMGADVHADNDAALFYSGVSNKPNMEKLIEDYAEKTKPLSEEERYKIGGYDKMRPDDLLRYSSEHGLLYGVKKAFELGASTNENELLEGLRLACIANSPEVIKYYILEKNVDINKLHKNYIDSLLRHAVPELKEFLKKYIKEND